jgi:purine-binding chemotaxis protein CheW
MTQLYLFARVAGTSIAMNADEVEAVVRVTEISPVPGMPPHVAGLSALRSRVLTMIDIGALISGRPSPPTDRPLAVITNISGHSYGLMVEAVRDICSVASGPLPLRGQIDAAWAPHVRAMVDGDDGHSLLVGLSRFVEAGPVAIAA